MKGSVWNKWELHIHSPYTHQNNQFAGNLELYAQKIINSNIKLIGVTNYFYFEDNELENIKNAIKSQNGEVTVLGNLEFRISQKNKDGEWINIHCIFSEKLKTGEINRVISTLPLVNTTPDEKTIYCSKDSLSAASTKLEHVVIDFTALIKHLNSHLKFGVDYLIAGCPNGYGGFRPNAGEGRSLAIANEIERKCQILLARPQDREYFLNTDRYEKAIAKPVFYCSDAHKIEDIGKNYCWVKAKPTFEGLRQAIIEPDLRVQQNDSFIENTYIKPKFKTIKLGGKIFDGEDLQFDDQEIELNPNLIAIIGGRGTGKSLFLNAMNSHFNHSNTAKKTSVANVQIELDKGNGDIVEFNSRENEYSYLHVSQGDVQKFSENSSGLSNEIKKMLRISESDIDLITSQEISSNIGKYRDFVNFQEEADHNSNRINKPEYQEAIIEANKKLIETLTNPQNKTLTEQYQENQQKINKKTEYIELAKQIAFTINKSINDINAQILNLNSNSETKQKAESINGNTTLETIEKNIALCIGELDLLRKTNDEITSEFIKQGINQDVSSLLSKIEEHQQLIDRAQTKLNEIKKKDEEYRRNVNDRNKFAQAYHQHIKRQKEIIDSAFLKLKEEKETWSSEQNKLVREILTDIHIEGRINFNLVKFYSGLEDCLNKGKFRSTIDKSTRQRLEELFAVSNFDSYINLLSGHKQITVDGKEITLEDLLWKGEFFNKGGRFELLNYLYSPLSVKSYLQANANFKYKDKTVDKLSAGQRGTFYVCLKLATDPFGSPFVFDQPEDDLDNEFIMKQLVPLFRKIKKYRQVIIVTHNANLVVNTDAEQVIVANNTGDKIKYTSGAVEDGDIKTNTGIRAQICNILEGGSHAFEKRERKYGIQELT